MEVVFCGDLVISEVNSPLRLQEFLMFLFCPNMSKNECFAIFSPWMKIFISKSVLKMSIMPCMVNFQPCLFVSNIFYVSFPQ